jgi:hypothetical protein
MRFTYLIAAAVAGSAVFQRRRNGFCTEAGPSASSRGFIVYQIHNEGRLRTSRIEFSDLPLGDGFMEALLLLSVSGIRAGCKAPQTVAVLQCWDGFEVFHDGRII